MPALTAPVLAQIAVTTLENFRRGPSAPQAEQEAPTYAALMKAKKAMAFTKGVVSILVRGPDAQIGEGWEGNDTLNFTNPTNGVRANYPRFLEHSGLTLNYDELLRAGLTLVDSSKLDGATPLADSDMARLANLLDEKNEQFLQGHNERRYRLAWGDGTGDPKSFAGIPAYVSITPNVGVVGGIDRSVAGNSWWRNRAPAAVTANAATQPMILLMQKEIRQLRRYGGKPTLAPCGGTFLELLEQELFAKGIYTQMGFAQSQGIDMSIADPRFKGIQLYYDPYLDEVGFDKRCYLIDPDKLFYAHDPNEFERMHTPDRSHEIMSVFASMTTSGGMVMKQGNAHGVLRYA